jgi:hypothetical protein
MCGQNLPEQATKIPFWHLTRVEIVFDTIIINFKTIRTLNMAQHISLFHRPAQTSSAGLRATLFSGGMYLIAGQADPMRQADADRAAAALWAAQVRMGDLFATA